MIKQIGVVEQPSRGVILCERRRNEETSSSARDVPNGGVNVNS